MSIEAHLIIHVRCVIKCRVVCVSVTVICISDDQDCNLYQWYADDCNKVYSAICEGWPIFGTSFSPIPSQIYFFAALLNFLSFSFPLHRAGFPSLLLLSTVYFPSISSLTFFQFLLLLYLLSTVYYPSISSPVSLAILCSLHIQNTDISVLPNETLYCDELITTKALNGNKN